MTVYSKYTSTEFRKLLQGKWKDLVFRRVAYVNYGVHDVSSVVHNYIPVGIPFVSENSDTQHINWLGYREPIDMKQYDEFCNAYNNAIRLRLQTFTAHDPEGNLKNYSINEAKVRMNKTDIRARHFNGCTTKNPLKMKITEDDGIVCDANNPCCKDHYGCVTFDNTGFTVFDMVSNFYFVSNSYSPGYLVPRKNALICGTIVKRRNGTRHFDKWFICSEQFQRTWSIVMHGLDYKCTKKGKLTSRDRWAIGNGIITNTPMKIYSETSAMIIEMIKARDNIIQRTMEDTNRSFEERDKMRYDTKKRYREEIVSMHERITEMVYSEFESPSYERDAVMYPHLYLAILCYCFPDENTNKVVNNTFVPDSFKC